MQDCHILRQRPSAALKENVMIVKIYATNASKQSIIVADVIRQRMAILSDIEVVLSSKHLCVDPASTVII